MATAQIAQLLTELTTLARELLEVERSNVARPQPRLTGRERAIINAIGHGRVIGKTIADAMRLEFSHSFQDSLALMVRYDVLDNDRDGYAVNTDFRRLIEEPESPSSSDRPENVQGTDQRRAKTPKN